MALFRVWHLGQDPRRRLRQKLVVSGIGLVCLGSAWGKEPSLTAIELYDSASGAAYVQLTDVLINGKTELRNCATAVTGAIDKSQYGKLPKLQMAAGGVLTRGDDGVLRYRTGEGAALCVLPENVKFEHNASLAPASIAEGADLRGRALAPGIDGSAAAQPLKKGVTVVFVSAADTEKADYLLAQRVGTQAGWQNYLAKHPAAPHTDSARQASASLYIASGETAVLAYDKSVKTDVPSYAELNTAKLQLSRAHLVAAGSPGEEKLAGEIQADLLALTEKGQAELDAYKTALAGKTAGVVHLRKAEALVQAVQNVDATFPPLAKLREGVAASADAFESALRSAEKDAAAKRWTEAMSSVQPYREFAGEDPRLAGLIDAAYSAYFNHAQELDATKEWKGAIDAYQHALNVKATTEATEALKSAQTQYVTAENDAAAKAALEKSKAFEQQNNTISAYEVLAGLSQSQQGLVKVDIERLEPAYVVAASQRAKEISQAYPTIGGIGDERAVEQAYAYLSRAYELSAVDADRQAYELRRQNLADELAAWFLDRAKHNLQKPLGSGTEIGWAYLREAESYKAANLESVRDQMKMAEPAHGVHSSLSIRVQFRDQTSQRQSEGFASQMESAIAANLDTPGMQVKVIRSADATQPDLDPDFLIAGDVLEHNISMPPTVESKDSTYVAGVQSLDNPEWNKLNRQYEAGGDELRTAQAALQGAEAKGNKKAIEDANKKVSEIQAKINDLRAKLDATTKSRTEDIIRPYTYKKTTYDVLNRIVLQFRVDANGQKGEPEQVTMQERKQFLVVSEVKAEDANKVKNEGTLPDREELQNELENRAREELIKKVTVKVISLPRSIYELAQKRELDGYKDDAAEAYMRFLNVAPQDLVPERLHAEKFLHDEFNFQVFPHDVQGERKPAPALEQAVK